MNLDIFLRRCRTLATVGPARQALAVEAAVELLRARLLLQRLPFQAVAARWGQMVPKGASPDARQIVGRDEEKTARQIGWAVSATASIMPFKAMCLQQAVAAHAMLERRGIGGVLHYGAGRDGDGVLIAHAWLDAGCARVTGYPVASSIAEICTFVPR